MEDKELAIHARKSMAPLKLVGADQVTLNVRPTIYARKSMAPLKQGIAGFDVEAAQAPIHARKSMAPLKLVARETVTNAAFAIHARRAWLL